MRERQSFTADNLENSVYKFFKQIFHLFWLFFCISANADDKTCGPGALEYVVFVGKANGTEEGIIVIKLNVFDAPNFTDRLYLQRDIFDAYLNNNKVILYTNTCQKEDYGFSQFKVLSKNDDGE